MSVSATPSLCMARGASSKCLKKESERFSLCFVSKIGNICGPHTIVSHQHTIVVRHVNISTIFSQVRMHRVAFPEAIIG